tara:strand:- start:345 stop:551 length:207 start_codon:yes stop_codon:yes gene_type:complete
MLTRGRGMIYEKVTTKLSLSVSNKIYKQVTDDVWYEARSGVWHATRGVVRDSIRDEVDMLVTGYDSKL